MKIFCVIDNYSPDTCTVSAKDKDTDTDSPSGWYMLPDSALVRNNNPMFVPDFDKDFVAFPSLVVRIGKLGKNIARKFASRYYNAVAPGLAIQACELLEKLKNKGLPWSRGVVFDRCCMLGDFKERGEDDTLSCEDDNCRKQSLEDVSVDFEGDGHTLRWNGKSLIKDIDVIISELSRENTLKIGDLIYVGLMSEGFRLNIGDEIRGILNGEELLKIRLR